MRKDLIGFSEMWEELMVEDRQRRAKAIKEFYNELPAELPEEQKQMLIILEFYPEEHTEVVRASNGW